MNFPQSSQVEEQSQQTWPIIGRNPDNKVPFKFMILARTRIMVFYHTFMTLVITVIPGSQASLFPTSLRS